MSKNIYFANISQIEPYYIESSNTYSFRDKKGNRLNIVFNFSLDEIDKRANIVAGNIYAGEIACLHLDCIDIFCNNIECESISVDNIEVINTIYCEGEIICRGKINCRDLNCVRVGASGLTIAEGCACETMTIC